MKMDAISIKGLTKIYRLYGKPSDRLRDELAAAGWSVKDSRDGQSVTKI